MPDIVVMKFGGTSVRDEAARSAAREQVRRQGTAGYSVAVVVSAMGRAGDPYATETLIGLLAEAGTPVPARELDLAMSVGEILSAAFFAHFLGADGIPAEAFTGPQAGFLTDDRAGQAVILNVTPGRIQRCLAAGKVAVVAGFQGADAEHEIRTLGRGGSDTSAVALGAALGAREVEIYTDVEGIADCDPRRVPSARFLAEIDAASLLAMAEEGSKVVHPRAVHAAQPTGTPIRVRNTFSSGEGTRVHHQAVVGPARPLALAHRERQVLLTIEGGRPWEIVPELLHLGGDRYLLPDDVHLAGCLERLRGDCESTRRETGWATASLILAGRDANAYLAPAPAAVERLSAPAGILRWLVREERLDALLGELHAEIRSNT